MAAKSEKSTTAKSKASGATQSKATGKPRAKSATSESKAASSSTLPPAKKAAKSAKAATPSVTGGARAQQSRQESKPEASSRSKITPAFLEKQKKLLLSLKDTLLDSMNGVAKDTLRSRAEGSEGNAFGMHQADAGSDAYDRDFALNLLSQEQNSLYEIDEALKRIEEGTYGICEISGKPIPIARLEAMPFTRYTVECQEEIEKQNRFRARVPVTSLFGLSDEENEEEDEIQTDSKD